MSFLLLTRFFDDALQLVNMDLVSEAVQVSDPVTYTSLSVPSAAYPEARAILVKESPSEIARKLRAAEQ
ncbi:hypothetical protein [Pandoraea communis]|uniref:hypothetical protein n=1 Tax=Pandoraea communis TaxID=2508297 RepID=UPI0025A51A70|nr:hypothetical protein [Pandoraea communis]MDM8356563.1 hypothetical protein [Pandoraea communis]